MWAKLYWCVWVTQQGPTWKSLNPQWSSAGHWGGLIKGHLSPTMCNGAGWSLWLVPAERDRIHGTRKQGSPGQRDRRGLCARDFVHTRWRVNSLPIPHPSLAIPPNNHLLQRSCKHNAVPLPSSCSQSLLGQWGEPPTPPPPPSFCPSPTPKQTLLLLKFFGVLILSFLQGQ